MTDRIEPLRRHDRGPQRLEPIARLPRERRRRDEQDDEREPPRRPHLEQDGRPPDDGLPHVDVIA